MISLHVEMYIKIHFREMNFAIFQTLSGRIGKCKSVAICAEFNIAMPLNILHSLIHQWPRHFPFTRIVCVFFLVVSLVFSLIAVIFFVVEMIWRRMFTPFPRGWVLGCNVSRVIVGFHEKWTASDFCESCWSHCYLI